MRWWSPVIRPVPRGILTILMPDTGVQERVRLLGIDTAELGGARCSYEKELALEQRNLLRSYTGDKVHLEVKGRDTYGRLLANIYSTDGAHINQLMLDHGQAREYGGGYRSGWC